MARLRNWKRTKEWCLGCDTAKVEIGKKCPICGARNKKKLPRRKGVSDG